MKQLNFPAHSLKKIFWISAYLLAYLTLQAQSVLPRAVPESVGLSAERLARIDEYLQGMVKQQFLPGAEYERGKLSEGPKSNKFQSYNFPTEGAKTYFSGGSGLVSSAADFLRFGQMLLNGGELDGVRILSRKTVELMTTNHVGTMMGKNGFGLGFYVTSLEGAKSHLTSVGSFGWSGYFNAVFGWIHRKK